MASDFRLTFPRLRKDTWGEIRSEIDDRDPLEACGDAAMHVIITEILVVRLRDEPDGKASRF